MEVLNLFLSLIDTAALLYIVWLVRPSPEKEEVTVALPEDFELPEEDEDDEPQPVAVREPLEPVAIHQCRFKKFVYPDKQFREFHSNPNCTAYSGEELPADDTKFHRLNPLSVKPGVHDIAC